MGGSVIIGDNLNLGMKILCIFFTQERLESNLTNSSMCGATMLLIVIQFFS